MKSEKNQSASFSLYAISLLFEQDQSLTDIPLLTYHNLDVLEIKTISHICWMKFMNEINELPKISNSNIGNYYFPDGISACKVKNLSHL